MGEKGLYYPVIRRIIAIVAVLIVIGGFLSVYYLVYLPQEHASYNLRTFRILHEIEDNFKQRVANYGSVYSNIYISQKPRDKGLYDVSILSDTAKRKDLDSLLKSSFKGNASDNDSFYSTTFIKQDSAFYSLYKNDTTTSKAKESRVDSLVFEKGRSLSDILQPLISVHSDVFESILLIKQTANKNERYDSILYTSEKSDIANINTDSIFKNNRTQSPVITDIDVEGISYKMFLLPFKMQGEPKTFVLAGVLNGDIYRTESQNIPVNMLLSVGFLLVALLVSLPFLKIFFLSNDENIKINDVRAVITVIFIIPFFVTLVFAGILILMDSNKFSNKTLASLQNNIQQNFYNEIRDAIHQAKHYDSILNNASTFVTDSTINGEIKIDSALINIKHYDSSIANYNELNKGKSHKDSIDIKDILFYPLKYKNVNLVHWLDANGNDIAAWNFNKLPSSYLKLFDRPYFQAIKYNRDYFLNDSTAPGNKDAFTILPILSRLTGEYIFNIAMPSNTSISKDKKAIAVSISAKMYSIYNTILPKGFSFCIIDEKGNIVCHSDTARSLQENIFQEASDSFALRSVINHKTISTLDMNLYEQPVRMLMKPLPGLPYYLVTYYYKRGGYLFIFHVLAFVFLCEAVLLLFVSLFSYFMMLSSKKNSKLFFTHATLSWLRPSPEKRSYYIENSIQFIACLLFIMLVSLVFIRNEEDYYLYTLNIALLLPLFAVTSYYITKSARNFFQNEETKQPDPKNKFRRFIGSMLNIFILYFVSILLFKLFQNALFFNKYYRPHIGLEAGIFFLAISMPFLLSFIAKKTVTKNKQDNENTEQTVVNKKSNHLFHFIFSLLLGVTLVSIIPSIILISYAFREEKLYQLQSFQIDLAKKIQQRRTDVNSRLWQTKLNIFPLADTSNFFYHAANDYIDTLKFDEKKGIYLLIKDSIAQVDTFYKPVQKNINCSPLYKRVTQFLFLPPDHDEFYDGVSNSDYYYWDNSSGKKNNTLKLTYNNLTDNRKPAVFLLKSTNPKPQLFKEFTTTYITLLILLVLFMLLFYKIIYSVCVRVFLIGFFEEVNGTPGNEPDKELEKQVIAKPNFLKKLSGLLTTNEITFKTIRDKENEKISNEDDADGFIIELQFALADVYESLWNSCNDVQKYTLYDFATDGFTNYKKVLTLHQLYKKGLIIKEPDGNITIVTKSFRNFLITKQTSSEITKLSKQGKSGSWSSLRTIFYIVLIAVAIFIFLSQEEASKRLITIITSLGALLPAMFKLFDKSSAGTSSASKSG